MSKLTNARDVSLTVLFYALTASALALSVNALFLGHPIANILDSRDITDTGGGGPDEPPMFDDVCFSDLVIYDTVEGSNYEPSSNARKYIKNYIDSTRYKFDHEHDSIQKGFLVTTEMIQKMKKGHDDITSAGLRISGFHVYYGDKNPSIGEHVFVLAPLNEEGEEFNSTRYWVFNVEDYRDAPCPMLCEGYNLLPPEGGE